MKNVLKRLIVSSIVMDIILIIFGLFLLSNPSLVISVSNKLIGIILIINGLYSIIKYIMNKNNTIFKYILYIGIISSIVGIIMMFNPMLFNELVTIVIGLWIIIYGLIKIMISLNFKYYKEETWLINMVISIINIILGIMLIINPFKGSMVISVYIGIIIVLYSSFDILEKSLFYKRINNVVKIIIK